MLWEWKEDITPMHKACKICIVIPCYAEKDLEFVLADLATQNLDLDIYEVVVVVNRSNDEPATGVKLFNLALKHCLEAQAQLTIHCLEVVFTNKKKAGVGAARKTGMDLAFSRFVGNGVLDGLIVCLDADCRVESNYLEILLNFYIYNKESPAAAIKFQHPLDLSNSKTAIFQYELHLRYFIQLQRLINLPYSFHTVGSSMLVRAFDYAKMGGMNTRRAGEDFYFLHKFTLDPAFAQIDDTCVIPASRMSDRVPFGTGRAVKDFDGSVRSYSIKSFEDIEYFLSLSYEVFRGNLDLSNYLDRINKISVYGYLESQNIGVEMQKILSTSRTYDSMYRAFFSWYNPFRLMRSLHYARDHFYPNRDILELASELITIKSKPIQSDLLTTFRDWNEENQWRAGLISS